MDIINDYKQLRIIESLKFAEENKKLKEENAKLKQKLNEWEKELQSNEKIINRLIKENAKLKEELKEIRGINNEFFNMNYGFDEQCISYDVKEVAREIQDKINEVLKDE